MNTILRTTRLRLRRFTTSDVDNLWALDGDPQVTQHLDGTARSREQVRDELLPRYLGETCLGHLAIQTADGTFVGWLDLRPVRPSEEPMVHWTDADEPDVVELGYRIRAAAWGNGFATEGALGYLRHAFEECGVRRVVATTMAVNAGSRRVLEKCGLRYLRTRYPVWPEPLPGNEYGDVEYAASRAEWAAGTGARTADCRGSRSPIVPVTRSR